MTLLQCRLTPWIAGLLFSVAFLSALPAQAVIRTFVASTGSDANACSRTAPCRTFGAAIAQTDTGGEVIVLDSAGYGPATGSNQIIKSVSVICPSGIYASVSVGLGEGITVNGSGINVVIKGLSFVGQGGNGTTGISFKAGNKLVVEDCSMSGFSGVAGIVHNAAGGSLYVNNTRITDSDAGIYLYSTGAAGTVVQATIDHCQLNGNNTGINCSNGCDAVISYTTATKGIYGFLENSTDQYFARMHLWNCVSNNNSNGVLTLCSPTTGLVLIANSLIIRNTVEGIGAPNGGHLFSGEGNVVTINAGNSTFPANSTIPQK